MAKKDKVVKRNDGVNGTPYIDRHVIGGKYVTPTKYNKMGWLGKRMIAGVRPDIWDAKFDSYQEPVDSFQPGGSLARRLWNKWTGKDTYTDGYGTTRSHVPVRESAHNTALKAADSPLVQAIPVVGDIADGYVAADYAAKGDYRPAIAAVGTGLILPNAMEVGARMIPSSAYKNVADKADDLIEVLDVETPGRTWNRTSDKRFDTMHDNDPTWVPEEVTPTEGYDSVFDYDGSSQSNEPWWGWDPIEYQKGGEIARAWGGKKLSKPTSLHPNTQGVLDGTHGVKDFYDVRNANGDVITELSAFYNGGVDVPDGSFMQVTHSDGTSDYYENSAGDVTKLGNRSGKKWFDKSRTELLNRINSDKFIQQYRPVGNEAPMPNMQEGGEIPANDQQQQLFVAIITDMAKTLGVEPSQEFAEAVLTAFEKQDDSQGLLTLFTKTKDKFMNETGLFREGGKMYAFVEKFKCGGKSPKKRTSKKQEGGEVAEEVGAGAGYITTPVNDRQMRRNWRQATGGTRREARQAQRNLTNYIEGQGGISHRGARNAAAAMMGDPQRFATPTQTPTLRPMGQAQLNVSTPALNGPQDIADMSYDHLGFNQAFGRARGNGVNTFNWRGKEYTTELAAPSAAPQGRVDQVQENVNNAIDGWQERANNAVDGWQERANSWVDGTRYGDSRLVNGAQTVGNAVVDGTQWLGNAAVDGVQAAGNAVVDGTQAIGRGVRRIFRRRQ